MNKGINLLYNHESPLIVFNVFILIIRIRAFIIIQTLKC